MEFSNPTENKKVNIYMFYTQEQEEGSDQGEDLVVSPRHSPDATSWPQLAGPPENLGSTVPYSETHDPPLFQMLWGIPPPPLEQLNEGVLRHQPYSHASPHRQDQAGYPSEYLYIEGPPPPYSPGTFDEDYGQSVEDFPRLVQMDCPAPYETPEEYALAELFSSQGGGGFASSIHATSGGGMAHMHQLPYPELERSSVPYMETSSPIQLIEPPRKMAYHPSSGENAINPMPELYGSREGEGSFIPAPFAMEQPAQGDVPGGAHAQVPAPLAQPPPSFFSRDLEVLAAQFTEFQQEVWQGDRHMLDWVNHSLTEYGQTLHEVTSSLTSEIGELKAQNFQLREQILECFSKFEAPEQTIENLEHMALDSPMRPIRDTPLVTTPEVGELAQKVSQLTLQMQQIGPGQIEQFIQQAVTRKWAETCTAWHNDVSHLKHDVEGLGRQLFDVTNRLASWAPNNAEEVIRFEVERRWCSVSEKFGEELQNLKREVDRQKLQAPELSHEGASQAPPMALFDMIEPLQVKYKNIEHKVAESSLGLASMETRLVSLEGAIGQFQEDVGRNIRRVAGEVDYLKQLSQIPHGSPHEDSAQFKAIEDKI
jgi:hypothetical protein